MELVDFTCECGFSAAVEASRRLYCECGAIIASPTGPVAMPRHKSPRVRRPADNVACVHRSTESRREWCSPCSGWIKIYRCEIHGECAIGKTVDGIRSCRGCTDFRV